MSATTGAILGAICGVVIFAVFWTVPMIAARSARLREDRDRAKAAPWVMFSRRVDYGDPMREPREGWAVGIERVVDGDPIESERLQFWHSRPERVIRVLVEEQARELAAERNRAQVAP